MNLDKFNIGDRIFKSEDSGGKLPYPLKNSGVVYCSNFNFTGSPTASVSYTVTPVSDVSPRQSFFLLGVEANTKCVTVANALKPLDYVLLSVFGASLDLQIPYPAGMNPTGINNVLQTGGDPENKTLSMSFGGGILIVPNTGLTISLFYSQAAAFVATDVINGSIRMYWTPIN